MDYTNVQINAVKAAYSRDIKGKDIKIRCGHFKTNEENNIGFVINDGAALVLIPEDKVYVNIEKVFKGDCTYNFQKVLNMDDITELTDTEEQFEVKLMAGRSCTARKFKNPGKNPEENIFLDENLLKIFKSARYPVFKGTDRVSPVYVFEDKRIVGLIFPIKVNVNTIKRARKGVLK